MHHRGFTQRQRLVQAYGAATGLIDVQEPA
jgi:hypothetical protein